MEQKRAMTSVDLAALSGELESEAVGAWVDKAYRYPDDLIRLKLRHPDTGRLELVLAVGETTRAHLTAPERVPDAPDRPPQFARMLRSRLGGLRLSAVEQYEFDRILEFTFGREDERVRLIAELFGDGNVAVATDERVVECLETIRLKSRTVAPGEPYEFPESRTNPLTVDRETFGAVMADSDTDVVRTLATQVNFGGLYAEEVCTRAGVEKTLDIEAATEATYDRLFAVIEDLAEQLASGPLDPRLYTDGDQVVDVTPVPLEERASLEATPYDRFMAAVDEYFHRLETETEEPDSSGPDLAEEIERTERIVDQQAAAIEDFEAEADRTRERAELLYANYGFVDEVLSAVQTARSEGLSWEEIANRFDRGTEQGIEAATAVQAVDGAEGTVTIALEGETITLEAAVGVEHNADRLYREAKQIEDKRAGAIEALEETRDELAALEERAAADPVPEEEPDPQDRDWLEMDSVPVRTSDEWYDRFRWFQTTDDVLVIGGRNADQNEELVRKYLEPGDRVLHTQAHGGPVTVIKATDPSESARPDRTFPESTIEQAAQFAVSYSSVWKAGQFAGDVYMVGADQVSKTPESGEYLEKGGFAVRGERTYLRDTPVGAAVGIQCEPVTRVVGGPPQAIDHWAETSVAVEPGRYAQSDAAQRIYRTFRDRFADESLVRSVASPNEIGRFLPPGGSRILD